MNVAPKKEGEIVKGLDAVLSNIRVANEIGNILQSTYGPRGKDKLLVKTHQHSEIYTPPELIVTNDGATILQYLNPKHPVAKMFVDLSISQDYSIGDGTTTVALFASNLLRNSVPYLQKGVSTKTITKNLENCLQFACKKMESLQTCLIEPTLCMNEKIKLILQDEQKKSILKQITSVPLNSKILSKDKEFFLAMLFQCLEWCQDEDFNLDTIQLTSIPGGSLSDSFLLDGLCFYKSFTYAGYETQPKMIENPKVLVLNYELEYKHQNEQAKIVVTDMEEYSKFAEAEFKLFEKELETIVQTQCNVIIDLKPIGDIATQYFSKHRITNVSRIPKSVLDNIAIVTNSVVIPSKRELKNRKETILGSCKRFEERTIGEDRYCLLQGCNRKKVTIVIRGANEIIQEAVRSLRDAICVLYYALKEPYLILGAGAMEMELKESLAFELRNSLEENQYTEGMDIFEKSLEDLVCTLASNCGMDANQILASLRYLHHQKNEQSSVWGIDIASNGVGNVKELGIWEPLQIKYNAFQKATKLACTILAIETMIFLPAKETEIEKQKRISEELKRRKKEELEMKSLRKQVQMEVKNEQFDINVLKLLGFANK